MQVGNVSRTIFILLNLKYQHVTLLSGGRCNVILIIILILILYIDYSLSGTLHNYLGSCYLSLTGCRSERNGLCNARRFLKVEKVLQLNERDIF